MQKKGLTSLQVIITIALIANLTGVVVATQKFFKEKIGRMTCNANMRSIKQSQQIYHAYYNPGKKDIEEERVGAVNLEFLLSKHFLPHNIQCSQRGIYKWDSEGEIYCTYHGLGEVY